MLATSSICDHFRMSELIAYGSFECNQNFYNTIKVAQQRSINASDISHKVVTSKINSYRAREAVVPMMQKLKIIHI